MKCRSALGVIIGGIYIFCSTFLIIYIITILCDASRVPEEEILKNSDIFNTSVTLLYIWLVVSVVSLITSVLLVLGILKQRHTFMKPWIYSCMFGIVIYILRLIIGIIVDLTTGLSFGTILAALVIGLLVLGLQILIFYPIYTLYTDIRDAASAQEQRGLNNYAQNPPSYGELEKGGEMYN